MDLNKQRGFLPMVVSASSCVGVPRGGRLSYGKLPDGREENIPVEMKLGPLNGWAATYNMVAREQTHRVTGCP